MNTSEHNFDSQINLQIWRSLAFREIFVEHRGQPDAEVVARVLGIDLEMSQAMIKEAYSEVSLNKVRL